MGCSQARRMDAGQADHGHGCFLMDLDGLELKSDHNLDGWMAWMSGSVEIL